MTDRPLFLPPFSTAPRGTWWIRQRLTTARRRHPNRRRATRTSLPSRFCPSACCASCRPAKSGTNRSTISFGAPPAASSRSERWSAPAPSRTLAAAPARPGSGAARCSATACSFNSPMRIWTIAMTWRRSPNGATRRTPDVATEGPALARRRGAGRTTGAQGHLLPPFSTGQVAAWWIRRGPCPPVGATLTEGERYGQESRTRAAHASH